MQLNDILADAQDQDRGRDFVLLDPVTGKPTGISLSMSVLVDPYTQARQRITRIHATRRVGGAVLQPARFRKLKMAAS